MALFGHALRTACQPKVIPAVLRCVASQEVPLLKTSVQRTGGLDHRINQQQVRHLSNEPPPNFFKSMWKEIKDGFEKDKEMKENLKKFREETKKLEESDALLKAKEKYTNIQKETGEEFSKKMDEVKEKLSSTMNELLEHKVAKKGKEFTKETLKTAGKAAEVASETLSKGGQQLGKTAPIKTISESVRKEFSEVNTTRSETYRAPDALRKRSEYSVNFSRKEEVEANEDATGMVLHKDSRLYQTWTNFKDNNQYINKMFELKMKYDESDNIMIRATRTLTDKVSGVFGSMFTTTEMSDVLTEICRIDPTFDREAFIKQCQLDIIPNILEARLRGNLEILQDWCHEGPYNALAEPIKMAKQAGYKFDSKVLDIGSIEIRAGKMMEQGPVLLISFKSQEILAVRDQKGNLVEGDPDKVTLIMYVWALCRDQEELNPRAAWRLLDISAQTCDFWY